MFRQYFIFLYFDMRSISTCLSYLLDRSENSTELVPSEEPFSGVVNNQQSS